MTKSEKMDPEYYAVLQKVARGSHLIEKLARLQAAVFVRHVSRPMPSEIMPGPAVSAEMIESMAARFAEEHWRDFLGDACDMLEALASSIKGASDRESLRLIAEAARET